MLTLPVSPSVAPLPRNADELKIMGNWRLSSDGGPQRGGGLCACSLAAGVGWHLYCAEVVPNDEAFRISSSTGPSFDREDLF